jgi:hypothetical protein
MEEKKDDVVTIKIILDKYWGSESALIKKDTVLYNLKMNFIKELHKEGLLVTKDLDERNMTPHIRITNKTHAKDNAAFNMMNGINLIVDPSYLRIQPDFIDIYTGHSGRVDTHMTMIYKKGIDKHRHRVMEIYKKVFNSVIKS